MAAINRILVLGDTHFPFHCKDAINKALSLVEAIDWQVIVQVGDLYDQFSYSRFPKRIIMTPEQETRKGRQFAEMFWEKVHKLRPNAKKFQLKGNHDDRRKKQIIAKLPEAWGFFDDTHLYGFDNVETIDDSSHELKVNDISFFHGHRTKIGDHLKDVQYQRHVVVGHTHRGGVHPERVGARNGKIVVEANAGYLGNPFSEPLIYRPLKKYFIWTPGVLAIEYGFFTFMPFQVEYKRNEGE